MFSFTELSDKFEVRCFSMSQIDLSQSECIHRCDRSPTTRAQRSMLYRPILSYFWNEGATSAV